MMRDLLAGAAALGLMVGAASAQTVPPLLWDGYVVPTAGTCSSDSPIAFRATYRPYISDAVSGHMPSQLVVFTDFIRNAFGFRLPLINGQFNPGQLNGQGQLVFFFVGSEVFDKDAQANAANAANRAFNFVQEPAVVKLNKNGVAPTYIKITGTIVRTDNDGPGLRCASAIRGVFVQRPIAPAQ